MNPVIKITCLVALFVLPFLSNASTQAESNFKTLCVACHGELGHGDGPAGAALAEKPSNIYKGLNSWFESRDELIDTVLKGNEEMPAWGAMLSPQQVEEIFVYIETINQPKN